MADQLTYFEMKTALVYLIEAHRNRRRKPPFCLATAGLGYANPNHVIDLLVNGGFVKVDGKKGARRLVALTHKGFSVAAMLVDPSLGSGSGGHHTH